MMANHLLESVGNAMQLVVSGDSKDLGYEDKEALGYREGLSFNISLKKQLTLQSSFLFFKNIIFNFQRSLDTCL